MTAGDVLDVGRDAILVCIKLGAPIMLVSLAIGLLVSFFQALTQIQEQTLTFVPKMLITLVVSLFLMPFMLGTLSSFTERIMDRIASG
ncbi:MAG: flagellar biosynthesis protein FliQ [Alphaproteobacteria bacterium]|nr:flagellar biosynthesis protein FliQ [Alphaproteobacteria bacterium]